MAIGVWVGGLAWLLLAVRGAESPERRAAVARFSRLAGYALAVTVASGVLRAVAELGGWRHLFDTSFGTALLVKGAIVAGLIALGAVNRFANVPAVASGPGALGRLRRTVSGELVLAAGILAAAAVLSELPPAMFVAAAGGPTAPANVVVSGSDFATTVRVTRSLGISTFLVGKIENRSASAVALTKLTAPTAAHWQR